MAHEINLVPDIKNEMIKAIKLRNYIFFGCIVVAIASVAMTILFGLIMGGQRIAIEGKRTAIADLSEKLNSYTDLNDFLTIKNQVGSIDELSGNKKVLSRTFNILSALIPTGDDKITVSKLNVNLTEDQPMFSMEAQANAGKEPFIDYNVLDSFKKSMKYMRYDYGNYVDKEGNTIPAYCMIEQGSDGAVLRDSSKGIYAYWTIEGDGCNPSDTKTVSDYNTETYDNQKVVRIWRTPQYADWYKKNETSNEPYMDLNGNIENVEHFESKCYTYSGDDTTSSSKPKWTDTNECMLVYGSEGEESDSSGIIINESSNGRDSSNELVLRFTATITFAPEVFEFKNTHMLAIAPSGQRNVTDSYVQVQSMFGQRANDCADSDTACSSENTKGKE